MYETVSHESMLAKKKKNTRITERNLGTFSSPGAVLEIMQEPFTCKNQDNMSLSKPMYVINLLQDTFLRGQFIVSYSFMTATATRKKTETGQRNQVSLTRPGHVGTGCVQSSSPFTLSLRICTAFGYRTASSRKSDPH